MREGNHHAEPGDPHRPSRLTVVAAWLSSWWTLVMIVGAYAAAFEWRPAAYLLLMAIVGLLGGHLLTGFTEYRRIMRRPWPKVPPLNDDDW